MSVTAKNNKESKYLTINLEGQFDFSSHPSFRNAYQDIDTSYDVIVNLAKTEYVDSAALGIAHFEKKFDIS